MLKAPGALRRKPNWRRSAGLTGGTQARFMQLVGSSSRAESEAYYYASLGEGSDLSIPNETLP